MSTLTATNTGNMIDITTEDIQQDVKRVIVQQGFKLGPKTNRGLRMKCNIKALPKYTPEEQRLYLLEQIRAIFLGLKQEQSHLEYVGDLVLVTVYGCREYAILFEIL